MDLAEYLRTAESIVRDARRLVIEAVARPVSHALKADGSFVTDIDLAVEDLVRARLQVAFPDHGVVGEERAPGASGRAYEWVIDPIDGTRSLRHGVPLFGTLLALLDEGRPVLGVLDLPMLDRLFAGATGLGVFRNGTRVQLQDLAGPSEIGHEIIAIGERRQFACCGQLDVFDRLMRAHESVRTYCDCFGHALAIEGAVGAMVDYNLHLWDVVASEVLIREAGGAWLRLNANQPSERPGGRFDVIMGKPTVVDWVCRTLDLQA